MIDIRQPKNIAILAVLILLLGSIVVRLSFFVRGMQGRNEIENKWEQADDKFRQGNFENAATNYKDLTGMLERIDPDSENDHSKLELELSQFMERLSAGGVSVQQNLDVEDSTWEHVFRDLSQLNREYQHLQEVHTDHPSSAEYPTGLSFPLQERWNVVLDKIYNRATVLSQLVDQPGPAVKEQLQQLREMIDFFGQFPSERDLDSLSSVLRVSEIRSRIAERISQFQRASAIATQTLTRNDIDAAKNLWTSIERDFGNDIKQHPEKLNAVSDKLWKEHIEQLEASLKAAIQQENHPDDSELVGAITQRALPILPYREFAALARCSNVRQGGDDVELVFAQVEDRCYALEASSGQPVWVLRTGYDVASIPQAVMRDGQQLLIVPWKNETGYALTVADQTLKTLWTWQLPPGESFSGPPILSESSIYSALRSGILVQMNLSSGRLEHFAKVPSRFAGPLTPNELGDEAVIVGTHFSTYFFQLGEKLALTDVLVADVGIGDVVSACAIWLRPFAIVFLNDATANCRMYVYFLNEENDFQIVATEQIEGRVWEAPVVSGTRFLVLTDLAAEVVYGLRIDDLTKPLFRTFQGTSPRLISPRMPFTASTLKSQFIAAIGSEVINYRLERLPTTIVRPREVVWEQRAEDPTAVPIQPLQTTSTGIVVVTHNQNEASVRVKSVNQDSGRVEWKTSLGAPISQWQVSRTAEGGQLTIDAINSDHDLFRLTVDSSGSSWELASEVRTNATVAYSHELYHAAFWATSDPPQINRSILGSTGRTKWEISAPVASPLLAIEQKIRPNTGEGDSEVLPGLWLVWMDATRALRCRRFDSGKEQVQFARLNDAGSPIRGWYRPIFCNNHVLVVSHPDGHIAVAEIRQEEEVAFLYVIAERRVPGGIIDIPAVHEHDLWLIGKDGFCRALQLRSLQTQRRVRLPAPAREAVSDGNQLWVSLNDGSLATIEKDSEQEKREPDSIIKVSPSPLLFLVPDVFHNRMLAVDQSGRVSSVDVASGSVSPVIELNPPSVTPIVINKMLLYGDIEGRVQQLELQTESAVNRRP